MPAHRNSKTGMSRHEYLASGARLYAVRGSKLPQAIVNEALVAKIRHQYARKQRLIQQLNATYSAAALAKRYGLHPRTVEKILRRETWAHVA